MSKYCVVIVAQLCEVFDCCFYSRVHSRDPIEEGSQLSMDM